MTDNELKRLNRSELLDILIELTKENEELKSRLKEVQAKAESRQIAIANAGSIAEAAIMINGVFDAAQAAATQYLENIKRLGDEQDAVREQAELIRATADEYSKRIRAEADAYSHRVRTDAFNAVTMTLKKAQDSLEENGDPV